MHGVARIHIFREFTVVLEEDWRSRIYGDVPFADERDVAHRISCRYGALRIVAVANVERVIESDGRAFVGDDADFLVFSDRSAIDDDVSAVLRDDAVPLILSDQNLLDRRSAWIGDYDAVPLIEHEEGVYNRSDVAGRRRRCD